MAIKINCVAKQNELNSLFIIKFINYLFTFACMLSQQKLFLYLEFYFYLNETERVSTLPPRYFHDLHT